MRVALTARVICIVFCTISCSKRAPEPKIVLQAESWRYYNATYQKKETRWTKDYDSLATFTCLATQDDASLSLHFTEKPVGTNRYLIVYKPDNAGEVSITAWGGTGQGHAGSQDNVAKYLYVSNDNGKLHFFVEMVELEVYTMVSNYNVDCSINVTE